MARIRARVALHSEHRWVWANFIIETPEGRQQIGYDHVASVPSTGDVIRVHTTLFDSGKRNGEQTVHYRVLRVEWHAHETIRRYKKKREEKEFSANFDFATIILEVI